MAAGLKYGPRRGARPARSPWSRLVSMELDDEEKNDAVMPIAADKPDFPYGLRICLTGAELEKLGLPGDCEIGDMIDLRCFARVTSISKNESADSEASIRIEMQIESIALEDEMTEDE